MALCLKLILAIAFMGIALIPSCNGDQLQLTNRARRPNGNKIVIADDAKKHLIHLRVCNAFDHSEPLELLHQAGHHHAGSLKVNNLTAKVGLLGYKGCNEWAVDLRRGDSLEFLQNSAHLGSFSVSSVPQWDTLLLLVIHRRKSSSRAAFASHVFAKSKTAQVAVLDMYEGHSKGHLVIQEDKPEEKNAGKLSALSEELAYDSVVALDGGKYICKLVGGVQPQQVVLNTQKGESYVAMRVGEGKNEEIVVFPASGGNGYHIWGASLFLALVAMLGV
eukprot:gnl/MRDRNA2_/MRDRNA2_91300_c0_seq1.p1 gnl/MRDRNA2_/MRDRNA2_91300_c0~~gnl/MRDRNA2_/MRDRNA2_91300_c0_seq1.p1  ORF type:complete len:276 (+),score=49.63 gnl/MRDRNA2_/MRDRNA2_91300_c0_seq1:73-900(+)